MSKLTAKEIVSRNIADLRTLPYGALFHFAIENGFDSRPGFASFKKALKENGIDYQTMRQSSNNGKLNNLRKSMSHQIKLYCDAKASKARFAICDREGNPVWYGRFFENDSDFTGEQSSGELAVAKKAVWLASKVRESIGTHAIRLNLFVDAQWLSYANNVFDPNDTGRGGKARALGELAKRLNVLLDVQWIAGAKNPADKFTICSGYKKWSDGELSRLAVAI